MNIGLTPSDVIKAFAKKENLTTEQIAQKLKVDRAYVYKLLDKPWMMRSWQAIALFEMCGFDDASILALLRAIEMDGECNAVKYTRGGGKEDDEQ